MQPSVAIGPDVAIDDIRAGLAALAKALDQGKHSYDDIAFEVQRMQALFTLRTAPHKELHVHRIFELPELCALIFAMMDTRTLARCRRTCREWNFLIASWSVAGARVDEEQ